VRPLKLQLEGFTSFKEKLELDFSGLDLFAITGPTGAGKSSLIDAIVFALYGQVPRVGDDYKQLISHGAERLSVMLEFAVGKERYRIARTARPDKPSQQRFERITAEQTEPIADRVKEIKAEVDRILGLDYDGFTRSVVLPQGQFDAFLKGEPKERRKILVGLLNLSVYERMQQLANKRSSDARAEAEFIKRQLETDFAGATPEALEQKQAELKTAHGCAKQAEAQLQALSEAATLAQQARAHRREQARLAKDHESETKRLDAATATLDGAGQNRKALDADLDKWTAQKDAHGFDESRYTTLVAAKPVAEQLATLQQQTTRATKAVADKKKELDEARKAVAQQEEGLPYLEHAEAQAKDAEETARAEKEEAHREHAALALRQGLKPGDPCPVCAQDVKTVPKGKAPALDALDARVKKAETAARSALEKLQQARVTSEKSKERAESLERELKQAEEQEKESRKLAAKIEAGLDEAGFAARGADAAKLVAAIQKELQAAEAARKAKADLEAKLKEIEQKRAKLDADVAAATAERNVLQSRLQELEKKNEETAQHLDETQLALGKLAKRDNWLALLPPPVGKDEADVVESLRSDRQRDATTAQSKVATLTHEVQSTEKAIRRAADLLEKRLTLDATAALAKTLSDHLKAHELIAWIQEEALVRLAEAGSRHLQKLSQNRYTLRLGSGTEELAARAEQDFYVVDAWNGDCIRSVRTLSGGETFLASLALALALAESLTELGAESRATDALDSLFLDEGFGSLDSDTLDTVVGALDSLHGGDRMVGIVTHVRDLAERLPARLSVFVGERTSALRKD
jgi:DNA repair protein SbcC/Rad50